MVRIDTRDDSGGLWPCVESETDVVCRLLAVSPRWGIAHLLNRQVSSAAITKLVAAIKPLSYEGVLKLEEEAKEQAAGLRAFRKDNRPPAPADREGSARGRRARPKGRARSSRPGNPNTSIVFEAIEDLESDTSAGSDEDSELENY